MTNKYIDRILKFSENDFISLACKDRKNDVFHSNMTNDGKHRSLGLLRKTDYCNYISLNLFKDTKNQILQHMLVLILKQHQCLKYLKNMN